MTPTFAERLHSWRLDEDLTQQKAANLLEINRSYLSQLETGARQPGPLLERRLTRQMDPATRRPTAIEQGFHSLPVLSWAQAGAAVSFERMNGYDDRVPSDVMGDDVFAVRLVGDSMEPHFYGGDIVVLTPSIFPSNGDIVVANLRDSGVVCKLMHVKHLSREKHIITLTSYNPAYPPLEHDREDFNWIYPAAQLIRNVRRH